MQMSILDRILLLVTGLLAAYQVAVGIDGLAALPTIAYTIAFGVLLIAGLLLIILGFEVLDSPIVVDVSTVMPLSLALGLVWQYLPQYRTAYLIFALIGLLAVILTRGNRMSNKMPIIVLALVHGVAGMTIFVLPIWLAMQGITGAFFFMVGVGGGLIGVGGLLLLFLKAGRPILSREIILRIFPGLLLFMTICFVVGFMFG